jgi:hypothetical protein
VTSRVSRLRVEGIRVLIDHEGLTVNEVSRLIGHPRQLVKRLYDLGSKEANLEREAISPGESGLWQPEAWEDER